jgi:hypothetical protein
MGVKTRWPWVLLGGVVLAVTVAILFTDRCYVEEHRVLGLSVGFLWFVAFVLSKKVIRAVLVVVALGFCLFYQKSEFTPSAEAGAVATLRTVAASVIPLKQSHPSEGYPPSIPTPEPNCRSRNVYEFRYSREQSSTSVVADRFMLVAMPVGVAKSRGLRSFALTEDGHLYATNPNPERPANRTDQMIQ